MLDVSSRTLVTGFGAFLSVADNPSARLAESAGRPFKILDVSFEAVDAFLADLDPESFDRVLMLGVATTRKQVTPELFARNQIGKKTDVLGVERQGPIEADGPLLIAGTLWDAESLASLFPNRDFEISLDAGSFLCNYIYYRTLRELASKKVGFCHVPPVEALPLERQAELISAVLGRLER